MSVEIYESVHPAVEADEARGGTVRRKYFIRGTTDELEAYTALVNALPVTYQGLWLVRANVVPLGGPNWDGAGEYGVPRTPPDAVLGDPTNLDPDTGLPGGGGSAPAAGTLLGPEWSFSTTGGTETVVWSRSHKYDKFDPGAVSFDFGGRIGWKEDGEDEGVEVVKPVLEFTTHRYVTVTPEFLKLLADFTGTVNGAGPDNPGGGWLGYERRQVLFLGAEGAYKDATKGWQVTFKFAVARHRVGFGRDPEDRVAGDLFLGTAADPEADPPIEEEGVVKCGWDYLWVAYTERQAGSGAPLTRFPLAYSIDQVYQERDFRLLGLGG